MSALLQSYEDEFAELSGTVKRDLQLLRNSVGATTVAEGSTLGSADRATLLKTTQAGITKLKELNTNIQYESNDLVPNKRDEARKNLAEYKAAVLQYEKDFTRAKTEVAAKEREELLSGASKTGDTAPLNGGADNDVDRARLKMEENTKKMRKGTDILKASEQLVNEADTMADETITSLAKQGDQIRRVQQTTRDADDEINKSRRTLSQMQKVMIQNKAILIIIICVLLFLIFIITYMKFSGSSSTTTTTTNGDMVSGGDVVVPQPPTPPGNCGQYCLGEGSGSLNLDGSGARRR